jgi:hypothetical protein
VSGTDSLLQILGNGNGLFFAKCHWCHMQTAALDAPDELRILASVQVDGWHIERIAGEPYRLTCLMCRPQRGK